MNDQNHLPDSIESRLRKAPLAKTPDSVHERLQRESNLDKFDSSPSWPIYLVLTAILLIPLLFDRFASMPIPEPPLTPPTAEAPDVRPAVEAPDPGPLVPSLVTPPSPAPIMALTPPTPVEDEIRSYNVRVHGIEPPFSSSFGESAMAPWLSTSDS